MKVREAIERLRKHDLDSTICLDYWCLEDVALVCEQHDIPLTRGQQEAVLNRVESSHDAELGINWDVLEFACRLIEEETGS